MKTRAVIMVLGAIFIITGKYILYTTWLITAPIVFGVAICCFLDIVDNAKAKHKHHTKGGI